MSRQRIEQHQTFQLCFRRPEPPRGGLELTSVSWAEVSATTERARDGGWKLDTGAGYPIFCQSIRISRRAEGRARPGGTATVLTLVVREGRRSSLST